MGTSSAAGDGKNSSDINRKSLQATVLAKYALLACSHASEFHYERRSLTER
jgi:hypothetical protein